MENNTQLDQRPKNKLFLSIGIVLFVLIAGFFLLQNTTPPKEINPLVTGNDIGIMPITANDHILGDPNAQIIIVEYSDTECPFCKRFHGDMHKLLDNYSDVAWVYRHYPIPSLHTKAYTEAIATECASTQGGNDTFWRYTDEVYARTNSNDSLETQELYSIAQSLDLDMLTFSKCVENKETASIVDAHMADGSKNGVKGTPTSFVIKDGQMVQKIPGALPYEQLAPFIADLLK